MPSPVQHSGTIASGSFHSVDIECLGLNTATVIFGGEWVGSLMIEAKIGDSEWCGISVSDIFNLDGQAPTFVNRNTIIKAPITGYTDFRISGTLESGTAEVYIGACEGVEVMMEILSYTFIEPASDAVFKTQEQP